MLIYLDLIFMLNFIVDFLLIMGTNRLTGFPPEAGKAAAGAALGGIYGCICLMPELRFLGNFFWRCVFFSLMGAAAFGLDRTAGSRCAILYLLSMALGGIASGFGGRSFGAVCICALLLVLLCRIGFNRQGAGCEYVSVELNWQGRTVRVPALRDTGNMLRDPLTGEQVLVCGADVGEELLGIPEERFCDPASVLEAGLIPGLRLIPYHAVGQPGGLMIALRLKQVKIGGVERSPLVAFAPQRIGSGKGYRMLTGGII